jgi:hypothetical protein
MYSHFSVCTGIHSSKNCLLNLLLARARVVKHKVESLVGHNISNSLCKSSMLASVRHMITVQHTIIQAALTGAFAAL